MQSYKSKPKNSQHTIFVSANTIYKEFQSLYWNRHQKIPEWIRSAFEKDCGESKTFDSCSADVLGTGCRLENTMSKPMVRIGLIIMLIAAMTLCAWYYLERGKKAVYTDALLVQNTSQVAEETKDCFLLQEDDISV